MLRSVAVGGSLAALTTTAGCAGTTETATPTDTSTRSDATDTTSGATSPPSSETTGPCAGAFDDESTTTPACADTTLEVSVHGRPETPTPTDSTSTPYKFVKDVVVEVALDGDRSRTLRGCIETLCPDAERRPVSVSLPEEATTRTYEFGPFGYHCIGDLAFWVEGCRRDAD